MIFIFLERKLDNYATYILTKVIFLRISSWNNEISETAMKKFFAISTTKKMKYLTINKGCEGPIH